VGNLGKEEVPPGETVDIALEWTPPGQSMEFMQTATIWTSDPERKDIQLMIAGQVVPDVVSYPEGAWTVTVMESMPSQFKGMILSMLQDSFEITGIETSQPWISVTSRPLDADEVKREMGKSGYELTCEVQPVMAVGRFKETITVNTTIENHERFQFEIEGTRVGPFNIVGPGWYSEIQRLRMGRVPSATGKVVKLSLFAIERDPPLEIAIESVDPPVLKTSIARKVPNAAAADRVQYVLNLEVPQGATPDRYSDDRMIHLRLTTNHPEAPLIKFDVELQID
jgi:hypothetical protein